MARCCESSELEQILVHASHPLVEGRVCGVCGVCVHECGCLHGLGAPPQEEFRGSHGPRLCAPYGDSRLLSSQRGPGYLWGFLSIPSKRSRSRGPRRRAGHPVATRGSRPAAPGPLGCALSAKPEDTRIRLRPREGKKVPPDARGQEKKPPNLPAKFSDPRVLGRQHGPGQRKLPRPEAACKVCKLKKKREAQKRRPQSVAAELQKPKKEANARNERS